MRNKEELEYTFMNITNSNGEGKIRHNLATPPTMTSILDMLISYSSSTQ